MEPRFQVQLKIRKPAAEVFDAVANPERLSGYFVQAASGPLAEGATVKWRFAEVPGEHDVVVRQVVNDERIVFEWSAQSCDYDAVLLTELGHRGPTRVEMVFKPLDHHNTMVQISESGFREDPAGIEESYGNAGGWMHMMCSLKGYLEYGINLRAGGAF